MKYVRLASLLTILLGLTACQSRLEYVSTQEVKTVNKSVNTVSLGRVTSNMLTRMLHSPFMMVVNDTERPIIFIDAFKNKTREHIDTSTITEQITRKLQASGKFRFIDSTQVDAMRKQLNYLSHAGQIDPSMAISFGRKLGAQYMLYGNLSSKTTSIDEHKKRLYKINMKLMDLDTGLIEWSDQKQIPSLNHSW